MKRLPCANDARRHNNTSTNAQEQEECVKEVEMLALLDCPYIIKYYDSFVEQVCTHAPPAPRSPATTG